MQPQDDIRPGLLRRRVIFVALAVLIADLATKQVMLGWVFDPPQRVEILPFLNLVPVWNPGSSFGLLADGGSAMPFLLSLLLLGLVQFLPLKLFLMLHCVRI